MSEANSITPSRAAGSGVYLLGAGVLITFLPIFVLHGIDLWQQEQYQYFPFVIAAIVWLGWERSKEAVAREPSHRANWLPYLFVALAAPLLLLSVYSQWPWLGMAAFNLLAGAAVYHLTQRMHIRNAWGIWALLWLVTPPPIEFGHAIVRRLQLLSSTFSSGILDLLHVNHLLLGNTMILPSKELFVDEACSGIVSVMSVVAVVGTYAVWRDRSLVHFCILGLVSLAFAVGMNTVRICVVAYAEAEYSYDLASGWPHDVLGLVLFLGTFLGVVSTDKILEFAFAPIDISNVASEEAKNPFVNAFNSMVRFLTPRKMEAENSGSAEFSIGRATFIYLAIPLIAIGVWSAAVLAGIIGHPEPAVSVAEVQAAITTADMPESVGGWTKTGFEDIQRSVEGASYTFGEYSKSFTYDHDGSTAVVSFDFPYYGGWHELTVCYRGVGWAIEARRAIDSAAIPYVEVTLKSQNEYGYLVFSNFSSRGEVLEPPNSAILSSSWLYVRRRLLRKITNDVYQSQAMIISSEEITDSQRQAVRDLFSESQTALQSSLADLSSAAK